MKAIGISRKIDSLGRIVLPIEMRNRLGIKEGEALQILQKEDCIEIRKEDNKCAACGKTDEEGLFEYGRLRLCRQCAKKIGKMAN